MADLDVLEPGERDLASVATRLRAVREKFGLTQPAIAERLGYSRRQYINWENGEATPPIWALQALRREFDIDPEWILSGPDDVPRSQATPQDWSRYDRLRREVEALCLKVGIGLSAEQVEQLARVLFEEAPEAEPVARKKMERMLRAVALGKVSV